MIYIFFVCFRNLKREFWNFPKIVGWKLFDYQSDENGSSRNLPSLAVDGNILEAINASLNLLEKHYIDRDLTRTGNSIVVISPGTGIFKVQPRLAQITKQRTLDGGAGIDLISLSQPPLHFVPLFLINCVEEGCEDFYEIPHWMNVSYVDCEVDSRYVVDIYL